MRFLSSKKRDSILFKRLNSLVLLYGIYVVQISTAVIIYKLPLITDYYLSWVFFYYMLSFFCSLPQAGFSDIYGRKKHLLISCIFVLLSVLYLCFMYMINLSEKQVGAASWSFLTAGPACALLGVMGNFIPIARGGITDIKIHDFRAAIGLSTTLIGFGWITAVGIDLILPDWGVLVTTVSLQVTVFVALKYLFFDSEDSTIHKSDLSNSSLQTVISSYRWFGKMFLVTGGAAALLAYFFSESTFYPVYSLNEEGIASFGSKVVGAFMAVGYGVGVFLQWRTRCSDKKSIKFGILISLLSLISLSCYKLLFASKLDFKDSKFLIEGAFDFLLAFGFGFFVPSLFSMMASNISSHHAGRLFGAVDTTDTLALSFASSILWVKERLKIKEVIVYTLFLILFLTSCFFYRLFVKRFVTYEKRQKHKS